MIEALHMRRVLTFASILLVSGVAPAYPCSIVGDISPVDMVRAADVIVRALAVDYANPSQSRSLTTGLPDSTVRFSVSEVLKGDGVSRQLLLPGYLSDEDDFNDHPPPYKFVRPGGRSGSCIANTYRRGAEFLLILKRVGGQLTYDWYALGPVNEQLRPAKDPWIEWVRDQVSMANAAGVRRRLDAAERELAAAERRWAERRPVSYELTVDVRCFCMNLMSSPPTFRVSGMQSEPTGPLDKPQRDSYSRFDTVEELFAAVRRYIESKGDKVVVAFHPDLGYPVSADLDRARPIFDDELKFTVTTFRIVK